MNKQVILAWAEAIKQNKKVAYLTILEKDGSTPRGDADMLIEANGQIICGTIGGGAIEKKAIEDALTLMSSEQTKQFSYRLTMDEADQSTLQMACGGAVRILVKTSFARRRLIVVGAGHIGLALSRFAKQLNYDFVVVDDRSSFANAARFPSASAIYCGDIAEQLSALSSSENDAFVIVSHDHIHDVTALKILVNKAHFYLGMIGSKKKVAYSYNQLREAHIAFDAADIHAPIGLNIGGEGPEEIALSIFAEIQSVWYKKNALSLKDERS